MRARLTELAAALWGLAEATVFFIVPDVLLSWIAVENLRRALVACGYALAGALVGGTIVWALGRADPEPLRALFAGLPAIDAGMIGSVRAQLQDHGLAALFVGPLIGTPYKIYALEAGQLGFGLLIFLLVSVPARLVRFVLVAAVVAGAGRLLRRRLGLAARRGMLIALWIAFYAWYFSVMSDTAPA